LYQLGGNADGVDSQASQCTAIQGIHRMLPGSCMVR
jgi:hypothetical protein